MQASPTHIYSASPQMTLALMEQLKREKQGIVLHVCAILLSECRCAVLLQIL